MSFDATPVLTLPHSGQYHLRYWPNEDRVTISVTLGDGAEKAFWLTRRLVARLLPAIAKLAMEHNQHAAQLVDTFQRDSMMGFAHAKAIENAENNGELKQGAPVSQLVAVPSLIQRIDLKPTQDGGLMIAFHDGNMALNLALQSDKVLVFIEALSKIATAAEWQLAPAGGWLEAGQTRPTGILLS